MRTKLAELLVGMLLTAGVAFGQGVISGGGGGGGGGASALNDLTDVTLTTPADGDTLERVSGVFINRNLLASIGAQLATANCVPYNNAGTLACSANLTFDGTTLTRTGITALDGLVQVGRNVSNQRLDGYHGTPAVTFRFAGNPATTSFIRNQLIELGALSGSAVNGVVIGGDQTLLVKNSTDVTGVTTARVDAGAGQGGANIFEVRNNAGSILASVNSVGAIYSANVVNGAAGIYLSNSNWWLRPATVGGQAVTVTNSWQVGSTGAFRFTDDSYITGTPDTDLYRVSAGVVGVGVGDKGVGGLGSLTARSVIANPGATARPTCDSSARGTYWQTYGATSVEDTVAVCTKDGADAYAWRAVQAGSGAAVFPMSGTAEYRAFPLDAGAAATLKAIACTTDVSTSTIDLDVTYGAFATAGTAVTSATIECGTTRTEVTSFAAAAITAGTLVRFATSNPVNAPTQVLIEAYWSVP